MRLLIAHKDSDEQKALAEAVKPVTEGRCEVITASEGMAALDLLLHDDPPDVAFVDWDLPHVDGPEMCRLVRDFHHHHDTHLIVLAGPGHADTTDAWRAGADDCVGASAPASELRARVEEGLRAVGASRARDELSGPAKLEALRTAEPDDHDCDSDAKPTLEALLASV